MKTITIGSKKTPVIVDDDFDDGGYSWNYSQGYFRVSLTLPRKHTLFLHRWLTGAGKGQFVYFRNGDKRDMRRDNLYVGPHRNYKDYMRRHVPKPDHPYRGVTRMGRKFQVSVGIPTVDEYGYKYSKTYYCGRYENADDAARVWDYFSEFLNGPGKYKNFPQEVT